MSISNIAELLIGAIVLCAVAFVFGAPPVRAATCGPVSWYGGEHHGRKTASGEVFNQWGMTAAMVSRKELGRVYRVTAGGRSVIVRITDTGGFGKYGRVMDLSKGAFAKLAPPRKGVIQACAVRVR